MVVAGYQQGVHTLSLTQVSQQYPKYQFQAQIESRFSETGLGTTCGLLPYSV